MESSGNSPVTAGALAWLCVAVTTNCLKRGETKWTAKAPGTFHILKEIQNNNKSCLFSLLLEDWVGRSAPFNTRELLFFPRPDCNHPSMDLHDLFLVNDGIIHGRETGCCSKKTNK